MPAKDKKATQKSDGFTDEERAAMKERADALPAELVGTLAAIGIKKGQLFAPDDRMRAILTDGNSHSVDSSDMAFKAAAKGAFREVYGRAKPVIHEPIMKVVVETPTEFQGAVMGSLNQRRGMIVGSQEEGNMCVIESQVPLAEMQRYSTSLRAFTQGRGFYTMRITHYENVPNHLVQGIVEKFRASGWDITDLIVMQEDVHFELPAEVLLAAVIPQVAQKDLSKPHS